MARILAYVSTCLLLVPTGTRAQSSARSDAPLEAGSKDGVLNLRPHTALPAFSALDDFGQWYFRRPFMKKRKGTLTLGCGRHGVDIRLGQKLSAGHNAGGHP